jgi:hypothetical protein
MKEIARELGRTVRIALHSWSETLRLSILITVIAAAIWTYYHT